MMRLHSSELLFFAQEFSFLELLSIVSYGFHVPLARKMQIDCIFHSEAFLRFLHVGGSGIFLVAKPVVSVFVTA
jgi:hypothetical protein